MLNIYYTPVTPSNSQFPVLIISNYEPQSSCHYFYPHLLKNVTLVNASLLHHIFTYIYHVIYQQYTSCHISYISYIVLLYHISSPVLYSLCYVFLIIGVKHFCGQYRSIEKHSHLEMRFGAVDSGGLKFKTCFHS